MQIIKMIVWGMMLVVLFSAMAGMSHGQRNMKGIAAKAVIYIHNVYDLQNMSKDLNASYELANDIDATITKNWNNGSGFEPVGDDNNPFQGTFDGNGHKIINLWINRSSKDYVGLFGEIASNSTIENIGLINLTVIGKDTTGGLVGENYGAINSSYVMGNVSGFYYVGILTGFNSRDINNSYVMGNVSGWDDIGGLIGRNVGAISNSHYNVDKVLINNGHHLSIGGLFDSQYQDWFSHGLKLNISDYSSTLIPAGDYYEINSIQGLKDLLGFADMNYKFRLTTNIDLSSEPGLYIPYFTGEFDGNNHTISNIYISISFAVDVGMFGFNKGIINNIGIVKAYVSGEFDVGGLVGRNEGTIVGSYATGKVIGDWVGGLAGYNSGTITNSYTTANVTGESLMIGGLAGINEYGSLKYTYAAGKVSASSEAWDVGGLVGANDHGSIIASFWDITTTGQTSSAGGTGMTTEKMKNKTTFTSAGWDFINIWNIWNDRTYPFFKWQNVKAVPEKPLNIQAKSGSGCVNLTWIPPADDGGLPITEYRIYRNGMLISSVSSNQLYYNDTNVVGGQTYTYYVTAVNAAGESPKSNAVQATPGGAVPEMNIWLVGLLAIALLFLKRRH